MKLFTRLQNIISLILISTLSNAATLDEVMDRHAEVMGGLENILQVKSSVALADVAMAGMEGTASIYYKYPDKYRNDVHLPLANITQAAAGGEFWMVDLNGQVRRMSGEEAQEMITSIFIASGEYLKPEHRGSAVTLAGEVEIDGQSYHRIHVLPPDGRETDLYIDTGTNLIAFSEFKMQIFTIRSWQEDYRQVGNVMVPFRIRQVTGVAALDVDMSVTSYDINAKINDSLFYPPGQGRADHRITGEKPVELETLIRSHHLYVPVAVNGNGPYDFLLDTGAGLTIVGVGIVDELNLSGAGELPALGTGGLDVGSFITLDSISLGGATIYNIVAGELDLDYLNQVVQEPIDGIIGYDLFSRFVTKIDYHDSVLTLFMPGDPSIPGGKDTLNLEFEQNHPMVAAVINDTVVGRFRIDTGSMNNLDLYTHLVRRYNLIGESEGSLPEVTIHGLGGRAIESTLGRLRSFKLGDVTFRNLPCGFSTADSGLFAVEGIDGNIGGGLLARFTCVFDYPNSSLYLSPSPNFGEVSAGIAAVIKNGRVVVRQVSEGSSAEMNGVAAGDVIVDVDGTSVEGMELSQVHDLLNFNGTNEVAVSFLKGDKIIRTVLKKAVLF